MKTDTRYASLGYRFSIALAFLLSLLPAAAREPDSRTVPLRVDFPPRASADVAVPVRGGIPFPRGALRDAAHVRLLAGREEVPAQVVRTAVWPDGSVKWVLIDAVLSPREAKALRLEYGDGVGRARVRDRLEAARRGSSVVVSGPGLAATVDRHGSLGRLVVNGRKILGATDPARLVLHTERDGKTRLGSVVVEKLEVESPGPVRARVLVRGHFAVEGWGTGFPARVLAEQPGERVPFSLRLDFVRGLPVILLSHQIVYTGEPDDDSIVRWGFELPEQNAGRTRFVREPGLTEDRDEDGVTVVTGPDARLCWAPLRSGLALIRSGFENRPCAVGSGWRRAARIDLWPREAGPWDLRRYAREWAVGETGNRERPADIARYARVAAYGMAKSHDFVLDLGGVEDRLARARSLAGRALLVAPPAWVARSGALGVFAPENRDGEFGELEAGVRRYLDWFLFHQELYRWHGKLAYGFWQTRNGEIHRHDRWDRDYGRWGWSLNDGAGRIGHVLLLTYLRTLDRRYLVAGEAFCRAAYDTAMVHTERHLENARDSWWRVKGCSHRHGVQPFSGPYIGMRGSYPGGARILRLLTGDGVIADGLDLVASAALDYATDRPGAFGASGGSDGQGAGCLGLLHAYETTGDRKHLDACRKILDRSKLIPPAAGSRLGYGPSFGLFHAASEYLEVTGDEAFRKRFLALADRAVAEKDPKPFLPVLAHALRLTGRDRYRTAIRRTLEGLDFTGSLAELPRERWPGHGGPRRPPSRANVGRDLPFAYAALEDVPEKLGWPKPTPAPSPAEVPDDWWRPGGHPKRRYRPTRGLKITPPRILPPDGEVAAGDVRLVVEKGVLRVERREDGKRLATVSLPRDADSSPRWRAGAGRLYAMGSRTGVSDVFVVRVEPRIVASVTGVRVEVSVSDGLGTAGPFDITLRLDLADRPERIQLHAAGGFRLERWRVDMNDEAIPQWLNSDRRTRWPLWRGGGIVLGNADAYRIFRRNRADTAPVWVDEGFGSPGWLDVTDRGASPWWGVTVRLLRDPSNPTDDVLRSVVFDHEARALRIRLEGPPGEQFVGAFDLVFHDGWRPPLGPPDLTREQVARFIEDLDYGENLGLFALRHLLSTTHKVGPGDWGARLMDRGVEPRELLLGMQWRDGLRRHAERVGVRFDPEQPDETVRRILDRYR